MREQGDVDVDKDVDVTVDIDTSSALLILKNTYVQNILLISYTHVPKYVSVYTDVLRLIPPRSSL